MAGQTSEPGRTVASRVLAILDAFDIAHARLTLSEISRRSGLPLATTHRLTKGTGRLAGPVTRTRRPVRDRAAAVGGGPARPTAHPPATVRPAVPADPVRSDPGKRASGDPGRARRPIRGEAVRAPVGGDRVTDRRTATPARHRRRQGASGSRDARLRAGVPGSAIAAGHPLEPVGKGVQVGVGTWGTTADERGWPHRFCIGGSVERRASRRVMMLTVAQYTIAS